MTDRVAVIKTGWCDSYTGQNVGGNFGHLQKGGEGAERFNMLPVQDVYRVYTMPKGGSAPYPSPSTGWTVFHVARDPAEQTMKLVGWYNDVSFMAEYGLRGSEISSVTKGYDDTPFCMIAREAKEIAAADRPTIKHGRKFGSSSIFWLSGNDYYESRTDWADLKQTLIRLMGESNAKTPKPSTNVGDTRAPIIEVDEIEADDGGDIYGHSSVAESPEHLALKNWAVNNPEFFDYENGSEFTDSRPELPLLSGDRVDAVHINSDFATLIEVKSRRSGEKDIERGIFQCIKYKAVFDAMQKGIASKKATNTVLLVEQPVSDRLRVLAHRLGVAIKEHKVSV